MNGLSNRTKKRFLLIWLLLMTVPLSAESKRPMPTAQLPIEPASNDTELFGNSLTGDRLEAELPISTSAPHQSSMSRPLTKVANTHHEWATQGGLQMTPRGFGAQWRLLQYPAPWVAVTETLRYFASEKTTALFSKQYGLMLGLELQPWRRALVSPLINLQAGADRFAREGEANDEAVVGIEGAIGLELQLARVSSVKFQWVETYYPDLKQPLYAEQEADAKRQANFQVFFNLRWGSVL